MIAAKKYTIDTYESMSDFVHGNAITVEEIYIPIHNLTFNYNDKLNIFNEKRVENNAKDILLDAKDILLDESFVLKLVDINRLNNELIVLKKDISDDAKKLL